jgi:SOS response regulatory protein OraA/RecX
MRVVTALRERPRGRVAVELDGTPWRELPVDAVVRAELRVGRELDRDAARMLGRERRRSEALALAGQALRSRDRSARELDDRLARRRVGADARAEALESLGRAGLVDDDRFAQTRARTMAERGWGDAAIRADLEQRGLADEAVVAALGALEPESERLALLVERAGSDARLLRRLAGRGFDPDLLEGFVAK